VERTLFGEMDEAGVVAPLGNLNPDVVSTTFLLVVERQSLPKLAGRGADDVVVPRVVVGWTVEDVNTYLLFRNLVVTIF
jgi:hypothetical protein